MSEDRYATPALRLRRCHETLALQAESAAQTADYFRPRFEACWDRSEGKMGALINPNMALQLRFFTLDQENDAKRLKQDSNDALLGAEAIEQIATLKEVWLAKGVVTDIDAHNKDIVELGDTEWQFSDGPPGLRGSSSDYVDLEEGLAAHSGYIIHWVP